MGVIRTCLWAALVIVASASVSCADDNGICDHCGCSACLTRVCVPKRIEKEITKICWDYKCEDVCIPGPSKKCGVECREDKCGCWSFNLWEPTCARVKTRHVPVKTEVKRKVPAVEWVVEYRCPHCCGPAGEAPVQQMSQQQPPLPLADPIK